MLFDGINKVTLLGYLGKDPEFKVTSNGKEMMSFSLATTQNWLDKNTNEPVEKTEWHNVVVFWEPYVKSATKVLKKGSKVYIDGTLRTRKWTPSSGAGDRYSTQIVLDSFAHTLKIINAKNISNPQDNQNSSNNFNTDNTESGYDEPDLSDIDDDIPF